MGIDSAGMNLVSIAHREGWVSFELGSDAGYSTAKDNAGVVGSQNRRFGWLYFRVNGIDFGNTRPQSPLIERVF